MKTRTRIVATLGPATDSEEMIGNLVQGGVDVVRLNFSHGDHPTHAARIERVRRAAGEQNANVAILADLQGPKIRVGDIQGGSVELQSQSTFVLTAKPMLGTRERVSVDCAELVSVRPGTRILLDDGLIELKVMVVDGPDVVTRVVNGGTLLPHKGVNLPGVALAISSITDKDRTDLQFAIQHHVDYIALSFVRSADDVTELKRLVTRWNATIPVIAKIEKPEAMEHIDSIVQVSDGVMVARGDLGVEVAPELVPMYQKTIIRKANAAGKPVITATQMLESMMTNPRPTRAEASDVANAILDGTDAVMLSGETAVGRHPVEAVQTMERIAQAVESDITYHPVPRDVGDALSVTDAIGIATCQVAMQLDARVIITATSSGSTARMISRHRPLTPIFAVTTSPETLRRLALVWGIQGVVVPPVNSTERMVAQSLAAAVDCRVAQNGDIVVLTAGTPVGVSGRTNMVQVHRIGESL